MPEGPEVRLMSEFINQYSENQIFDKFYLVQKGNNPVDQNWQNFSIEAKSSGKEMKLHLNSNNQTEILSVFFGMTGNCSFIKTSDWNSIPYIRLRLDRQDGYSILIHGGYMGPKIKIGSFIGTKRGPDPMQDFEAFCQNIQNNLTNKIFQKPICEVLLNQQFFSGVGNYIRSTILYYLDINPFLKAKDVIQQHPEILELCRDTMLKSYQLNGGQLRDWKNPFNKDSREFSQWVYYKKGISCKDNTNRTFWFDPKWKSNCPYSFSLE